MGTAGSTERRSVTIEIHGKPCVVRELTIADHGEIENFIKSKYVRLYRESAGAIDPDELHKRIMEILKTDISVDEMKEQMDATDVQMFTAYLAISSNPDVTLETYRDFLDADVITLISVAVGGMSDDEEDSVNPPKAEAES